MTFTQNVLIVSNTAKSMSFFTQTLNSFCVNKIITAKSCSQARRLVSEQSFDLVIINAPLNDESGENFSIDVATKINSQVILVVNSEYYEQITSIVEDYGIITIARPIDKSIFWSALKLSKAMQSKFKIMHEANNKLLQKIEDIRIVDRAKCILISHLTMSESEAHKYIERQAMDTRTTKRAIAESILKTYEN